MLLLLMMTANRVAISDSILNQMLLLSSLAVCASDIDQTEEEGKACRERESPSKRPTASIRGQSVRIIWSALDVNICVCG